MPQGTLRLEGVSPEQLQPCGSTGYSTPALEWPKGLQCRSTDTEIKVHSCNSAQCLTNYCLSKPVTTTHNATSRRKNKKKWDCFVFQQLPPKLGNVSVSNWDCALTVLYLQIKSPQFPQIDQTPLSTMVKSFTLKGNIQKGKSDKARFYFFWLSRWSCKHSSMSSGFPRECWTKTSEAKLLVFHVLANSVFYQDTQNHSTKPQTVSAATQSICK